MDGAGVVLAKKDERVGDVWGEEWSVWREEEGGGREEKMGVRWLRGVEGVRWVTRSFADVGLEGAE